LGSDLQTSAGSFKTRVFPRWLPASFGPAAPSHGRVGLSRSARSQHVLGRSLLGLAREGYFGGSGGSGGQLLQRMGPSGGMCSTRSVAGDGVSRRRFHFDFCFWAVLFLFFLFTVCLCDAQMLRDCLSA
jgi:hypothetical protein